jgi:hypothetical protein
VAILLMVMGSNFIVDISGYSIMVIGGYFIVAISGYSINDYWWLFY